MLPLPNAVSAAALLAQARTALLRGVELPTSGSTGEPRMVRLTGAALAAGAAATQAWFGAPGRWVLAVPSSHIAGFQVTVRAALAEAAGVARPLVVVGAGGLVAALREALAVTDVEGFTGDETPVFVSLVPTQLRRLLETAPEDAEAAETLQLLARCRAVLVGGAAVPTDLREGASAAGLTVVATYGMTETAGGLVYDGRPLGGVRVRLNSAGRIEVSGPMLATEYMDAPAATAAAFTTDYDGTRWFITSDLGAITDGVLSVTGRADDVIISGGLNVAPGPIEALLSRHFSGAQVAVVGISHRYWGQEVVALVERQLTPLDPAETEAARALVKRELGAASSPKRIYALERLPLTASGKLDRQALAQMLTAAQADEEN